MESMSRVGSLLVSLLLLSALPARAQCPVSENGFLRDVSAIADAMDRQWWSDRPLYDARNAHRTNTKEEFADGLEGDFNWFEGDVRVEIDHDDRLEMRHEIHHESGDNLSLEEWLTKGKKAGKGLKLDIKESARMPQLLDTVAKVAPSQERLMFNLGDANMNKWGAEIRRRFPESILAINPRVVDGKLDVDRMIDLATRFAGRVTFVLHENQVTPAAVATLQQYGPVSIWGDVADPAKRRGELLAAGVEGMIDLGHDSPPTVGERLDSAKNRFRTWVGGL